MQQEEATVLCFTIAGGISALSCLNHNHIINRTVAPANPQSSPMTLALPQASPTVVYSSAMNNMTAAPNKMTLPTRSRSTRRLIKVRVVFSLGRALYTNNMTMMVTAPTGRLSQKHQRQVYSKISKPSNIADKKCKTYH